MRSEKFSFAAKLTLLFAVYFVTARIGLSMGAVSGFATLVWPPTGIALAALIMLGHKYWTAIALGAFLVNIVTGAPLLVALSIAVGNTLEALLGMYLLNRFTKIQISLERVNDVLGVIFFAAFLSTMVSATVGVTSLWFGGVLAAPFATTWMAWWVGDMLGALVVAPLILVWNVRISFPFDKKRVLSAMLPILLLIGACIFAFYGLPGLGVKPFTFSYVVFPFLVWIALNYRQHGSVTATFIVSSIAVWGTVITHANSAGNSLSHNLLLLQSFIGITAATFLVVAAVVSEREQTLKKEQQLAQKTVLLTRQRVRLETLNKAKDDFISIASHQLRTPATGVKQYLGMLLENYAGKLTKPQHRFAQAAYENNERQIRIINDLLRIASLDAGKVQLEKSLCDISELTANIVQQQSKEFENRHQKLLYAVDKQKINAYVDRVFLRMVVENIIDNAGKYSPEGGSVKVSLVRSSRLVRLQISDAGIGIAKKDQRKLFQKFSRINNPQSAYINGSGLGLYWAKKVVDMHGGTIKITSQPNKGSTFTIGLPAGIGDQKATRN